MPGSRIIYITENDPILLGLTKRINWAWLGYFLCARVSPEEAKDALGQYAADVAVACIEKPRRPSLEALWEETGHIAKIAWVNPSDYRSDPEGCVGRLIETLTRIARQLRDEQNTLLNSAFVTHRATELSERIFQFIDAGNYESLRKAIVTYVEMVVSRSNGSNQFIYVKIMELVLLGGYKPMQYKTYFDGLLEGDFSKKLQQVIARNSTQGTQQYLYRSICDSVALSAKQNPGQMGAAIFEQAIAYIGKNYNKKLSLEEVSHQAYMSPSYFSNSFHQRMGITFSEYLLILRMNRAKELLTTTTLRVYEVAEHSGYDDFRHFSKMFKKHTGYSPTEYRKLHPQKEEEDGGDS